MKPDARAQRERRIDRGRSIHRVVDMRTLFLNAQQLIVIIALEKLGDASHRHPSLSGHVEERRSHGDFGSLRPTSWVPLTVVRGPALS